MTLSPGHFVVVPFVEPPVPAGEYLLRGAVDGLPDDDEPVPDFLSRVDVTAPRYVMPPDQILSTYPPAGARGSFTSRLPQVVLRRRTLPWERSPDLDGRVDTVPTPWLAVVLIAEGEGQLLSDVAVGECVTPGTSLGPDADVPKGACLEVPVEVFEKVFPTRADLALLTHVRQVDLADTELALGDDDGWLAVVMGNRLPQPNTRYLACLVNLEGQWDDLPPDPPELPSSYLSVSAVMDLRVARPATVGLDQHVMNLPLGAGVPGLEADALARPEVGDLAPVAQAAGPAAHLAQGWSSTVAASSQGVLAASLDSGVVAKRALSDGFAIGPMLRPKKRFPVLAHWSFTCEERGDFGYLATNVHVRMLGHVPTGPETPDGDPLADGEVPPPPGNVPQPVATRPLPLVAETGHVLLDHTSRRGEVSPAWFRGPLVPAAVPRAEPVVPPDAEPGDEPVPVLAHHADQLRRVVPDGSEDLGYAAAFELGRLLALSQPGVVAALSRWRGEAFGAARVEALADRVTADLGVSVLGSAIRDRLAVEDPYVAKADALRPHTVANRALRAVLGSLGESAPDVLGAPRPVADAGVAASHLADVLADGDKALLAGFGLRADVGDPDALLDAVASATVQVAAQDDRGDTTALRARLEDVVGTVAAQAGRRGGGPVGLVAGDQDEGPDALDDLLAARDGGR